ncbi:cytosine permease [Streptosporangium sp. NPDC051023]|uniref:purine-cytosine permease family protein n=1 Tax=Streptosporangium sp. NPDC051023 TaxID=3155410 RepID=UPI0034506BCF
MTSADSAEVPTKEAVIGNDDYALHRVPQNARHHWFSIATQRFGQLSALPQFMLGATLGMGMSFWEAVGAITLGAAILEIVAIVVGVIGVREGMSTSVLARWTGFGRYGAALISLTIAISLVGWFGIQNAVFAEGLHSLLGGPPLWVWTLIAGVFVTLIVVGGIGGMRWTAYVTVPLFIALAGWSIASELSRHSLGTLVSSPAPGPSLSMTAATTLVAGSFIAGAVITPDMTRYNRGIADVIKQTVVGITLGEYVIGLIGVLLAHALRTGNVVSIVVSTSGTIGVIILVASTLKINDWNLYSSSLGFVNIIDTLTGRRVDRALVTVVLGVAGTLLAAAGILGHFTDFLIVLGVALPPVAGIMIAEYFVVRRWRPVLDAAGDAVPDRAPAWVPASLVLWLAAFLVGKYVTWGIPALNSLVFAFAGYAFAGKLGLTRGVGSETERKQ